MDGQRFDEFVRLVGTGLSRRRVLGALFGGTAAIAAGVSLAPSVRAGTCQEFGSVCSDEFPCCSPMNCEFGGCFGASCEGVSVEGGDCTDSDECCGFLKCVDGICAQTCAFLGEECGSDDDCCSGNPFCVEGVCALSGPECAAEGESCVETDCCDDLVCNGDDVCEAPEAPECEIDEDCVTAQAGEIPDAICCAGVCVQIECCIDDEDPNARCAEGATCFEGVCVFACKGDGDCEEGSCCCPDGSCSADCCDGGTPPEDDGADEVTDLPNTGIGDDGGSDLTGLLGAGLVAGAAAFLAGKRAKGSEQA